MFKSDSREVKRCASVTKKTEKRNMDCETSISEVISEVRYDSTRNSVSI